jgi:hypothetical protein
MPLSSHTAQANHLLHFPSFMFCESVVLALIHLRDSSYTYKGVRVASQHELLERAHRIPVARLCCPKDTLSQVPHLPVGLAPIDALPVGWCHWSVCVNCFRHLTFPLIQTRHIVLWVVHQIHVSTLSRWVFPYPAGYVFPLPFGCWPSLLGSSYSH